MPFLRLGAFAFGLALSTQGAMADICEEWWFARNLVFDRAGYCFGSTLGQALFDNSDCTTKSPALSDSDAALVATIRDMEATESCKVATSARSLSLPDLDIRRSETLVRVRDIFESACIGWRLADLPVRIDGSVDAPVLGHIEQGDTILLDHVARDGWDFVTVSSPGKEISGWVSGLTYDPDACDAWAG